MKLTSWKEYKKDLNIKFDNKDFIMMLIAVTVGSLSSVTLSYLISTQNYIRFTDNPFFDAILTTIIYSAFFALIVLFLVLCMYRILIFIGWVTDLLINEIILDFIFKTLRKIKQKVNL